MTSTFTTNISLEQPASGDYPNAWASPVNADWAAIDKAVGGSLSINVTSVSGTTVFTLTQYRNRFITFTGTLTANLVYQIPSGVGGPWWFTNSATGAFTITISSGGAGTSVVLAQGYNTQTYCDGTNVKRGDTNPQTAAPAGSNTQVQFNNSGVLGASASLTWNGTALSSTGFIGPLTGNVTGNVVGNLTGNVTGNVSGSSGSCTGNSATATTATNATNATTATYASIVTGTALAIGYLGTPASTSSTAAASDKGKDIQRSASITIPQSVFSNGDAFTITNLSSSSINITQGTGVTLRLAGTATTGTRALAGYGQAYVKCIGSNTFYVSGAGVS